MEPTPLAAPEVSASPPTGPRIVHASRGRVRVYLPNWPGTRRVVEAQLCPLPGVRSVEANPLTRNVLLTFDPEATNPHALLAEVDALHPEAPVVASAASPPSPLVVHPEGERRERRARIPMRGLDRNPGLASRIVQQLRRRPGLRALARPLTGHVLVEYDHTRVLLEDILAEIAHLELPDLPGEDRPAHPLDPEPLILSATRAIGALVGLAASTYRRLSAPPGAALSEGTSLPAMAAGFMHLVQGFPFVRNRLRGVLGKHGAEVTSNVLSLAALTWANFPLGLVVIGVESLVLIGEVTSRRAAWRRYEDGLDGAASAEPGAVIRLEAGMRIPGPARVLEGTGTTTGASGLPMPLAPGVLAPAGAEVAGGPFVLELQTGASFEPEPRPAPATPTFYDRYQRFVGPFSLVFAAFTFVRTGSVARAFEALLLLNPRTAVIGLESANLGAAARVLRAGFTVVGTRPERVVQLPNVLLLGGPRLLTDGLEIAALLALEKPSEAPAVLALASAISAAAGSPWGNVFPPAKEVVAIRGAFNGLWATADVDGVHYILGPPEDPHPILDRYQLTHQGGYMLELRPYEEERVVGFVALRPRLRARVQALVDACKRLGVRLELLPGGAPVAAENIGWRAGVAVRMSANSVRTIRTHQAVGAVVAFVSDSSEAAPAFAASDLGVGLAGGQGNDFPARTDLLAPDLRGLVDLLEAGQRRQAAIHDGVRLSLLANGIGIVLGFSQGRLGAERATLAVNFAALAAIGSGWLRLRGGQRPESSLAYLADPRPERWGRRSLGELFRAFNSSEHGLTSAEAATRRASPADSSRGDAFLSALRNQLRTPITSILAAGACVTLVLGQPLNTSLLALTISVNVAAGIWQEREVGKASEAIHRLGASWARVLRDGQSRTLPASQVVLGDILLLAPGDRVAADARLLGAVSLEVAEAALTGESLPVPKGPDEPTEAGRLVLEGSDVAAGTGRAVVVAVGRHTRLGATAAALNIERDEVSPMGTRLAQVLRLALPLAFGGGAVAGVVGLLYGAAPMTQFTVAITTALSAIPEGLPLLAGVGQAGVASRLSARRALVRRVAAVEARGRVDVACSDKTGTLTEGRLALRLVADSELETRVPGTLPPDLRHLLLVAALASPHPDAPEGATHPTDLAVMRGAREAGLGEALREPRLSELPFDSARAFHAALVSGRLCVKGAPERLMPRCTLGRVGGHNFPLDESASAAWLARGARLAERGLRVLMVAEGPPETDLHNPQVLTALGFIGINDPLRPTVPDAVRRCLAAGVRVIMLTGDHPATARAIAREAGLFIAGHADVVRAADLAELPLDELDRRLERVAVIARATPLDKLRIVESLRRSGHVVAMTGDGVNDAPALRLADVGVAMGKTGTEVARQASDLVLTDDDFATLVEALVEGRGFWRNMRNALGLLLGGNAGELGLVVGASLMGYGSPLSAVQILLVNMITDALPSLAVVLQRPQHRKLDRLAREGLSALDRGLRYDTLRRGLATGLPSLGAYLAMHRLAGPQQASAVAFTAVVATQLAQTLEVGRVEGTLSRSVIGAVAASAGLLVSSVSIPPIRNSLGLLAPSLFGWGVVGISAATAVVLSRAISSMETFRLIAAESSQMGKSLLPLQEIAEIVPPPQTTG